MKNLKICKLNWMKLPISFYKEIFLALQQLLPFVHSAPVLPGPKRRLQRFNNLGLHTAQSAIVFSYYCLQYILIQDIMVILCLDFWPQFTSSLVTEVFKLYSLLEIIPDLPCQHVRRCNSASAILPKDFSSRPSGKLEFSTKLDTHQRQRTFSGSSEWKGPQQTHHTKTWNGSLDI